MDNRTIIGTFAVFHMFRNKLATQDKTKEQFIYEFEKVKLLDDTMTAEDIAKIEAMIEAKFPVE